MAYCTEIRNNDTARTTPATGATGKARAINGALWMLEFENVSKSFWTGTQHKVILEKVSFRVEIGRSLGILAPNGTGKTTVINMMAGLEKPDEGVIRRGCRISFPLGFMGGVVSRLSARENARYIAQLYGIDPDYVEAFCRLRAGHICRPCRNGTMSRTASTTPKARSPSPSSANMSNLKTPINPSPRR